MKRLFENDFVVLATAVGFCMALAWAAFDTLQFPHDGWRSGGMVVTGPLSIAYGVNGLVKRNFPDFPPSHASERPLRFWSIALGFLVGGAFATLGGIAALTGL